MNAQEFAYWLNGFVELTGNDAPPTSAQWKSIKEHLNLVFKKVTPVLTPSTTDKIDVAPQMPSTPYQYPPYIDPFKTPQTYPDWVFPGYDPTRTIITC
jgi:hypothetical protein